MSFISVEFLAFFLAVFFIYWLIPNKFKWIILLISNYVFYSFAGIQYVLLLLYITIISYVAPLIINKIKTRKCIFVVFIILLLLPLVYFKYTGFIQHNINIIVRSFGSATEFTEMQMILPLGISFYSFSALGYVIDSIKDDNSRIHNFFHYAVGLSFFPCIVSGPIERQKNLTPQIVSNEKIFDYNKATYGLKLIAIGIYKKTVIADNLAVYVDNIWMDISKYDGMTLLIATIFYSLQIYCDFSGYSDIARGVAKMLSIEITNNFDCPYFSSSIQEFWRRWHISLSTWFRDYVYIPLGGNRKGSIRKSINLMITMLVSGLWHGASWKFVIWGAVHGGLQVVESKLKRRSNHNLIIVTIRSVFVFSICSLLWVLFRADSFEQAMYIYISLLCNTANWNTLIEVGLTKKAILICVIEIGLLIVYDFMSLKHDTISTLSKKPIVVRWGIYIIFAIIIAQFSYKGSAGAFVYAGF